MGTEQRRGPGLDNKLRLQIPSPTAYDLPSKVISFLIVLQIVEGPKISLSPRIDRDLNKFKRFVPGPGSYTPSLMKKANFSFSFGLKTESLLFN